MKVAKPTAPHAVRIPLDVVTDADARTTPLPSHSQQPRVGELRLHLKPIPAEEPGTRQCKVTIGIPSNGSPTTFLTGIIAREARPGWITLEIPSLEDWQEPMRCRCVGSHARNASESKKPPFSSFYSLKSPSGSYDSHSIDPNCQFGKPPAVTQLATTDPCALPSKVVAQHGFACKNRNWDQ